MWKNCLIMMMLACEGAKFPLIHVIHRVRMAAANTAKSSGGRENDDVNDVKDWRI